MASLWEKKSPFVHKNCNKWKSKLLAPPGLAMHRGHLISLLLFLGKTWHRRRRRHEWCTPYISVTPIDVSYNGHTDTLFLKFKTFKFMMNDEYACMKLYSKLLTNPRQRWGFTNHTATWPAFSVTKISMNFDDTSVYTSLGLLWHQEPNPSRTSKGDN
jgi:hypothetical protein